VTKRTESHRFRPPLCRLMPGLQGTSVKWIMHKPYQKPDSLGCILPLSPASL